MHNISCLTTCTKINELYCQRSLLPLGWPMTQSGATGKARHPLVTQASLLLSIALLDGRARNLSSPGRPSSISHSPASLRYLSRCRRKRPHRLTSTHPRHPLQTAAVPLSQMALHTCTPKVRTLPSRSAYPQRSGSEWRGCARARAAPRARRDGT